MRENVWKRPQQTTETSYKTSNRNIGNFWTQEKIKKKQQDQDNWTRHKCKYEQ